MFGNFFSPNRRQSVYDDGYYGYNSPNSPYGYPSRQQEYLAARRAQEAEALRRREIERNRLRRAQAYIPGGYMPYHEDDDEPQYDYGLSRSGYANPRAVALEEHRRRQLKEQQEKLEREYREQEESRATFSPYHQASAPRDRKSTIPIQDPSSSSTPAPQPETPDAKQTSSEAVPSLSAEEQNEAALKIQQAYRVHRSLARIASLEAKFEEHQRAFTFPEVIDFQVGPSGEIVSLYSATATPVSDSATSTASSSSTFDLNSAKLAFTSHNRPLHAHIEDLNRLLTSLDAVDSYGEKKVRERRKAVVKKIEAYLATIEGLEESAQVEQGWRGIWRRSRVTESSVPASETTQ